MNAITKDEAEVLVHGVKGRAFGVVTADNGRIMNQRIKTFSREYTEHNRRQRLSATLRFDDECRNGHETFAITADGHEYDRGAWRESIGGCCHDEIEKRFPELAPLIKWHLCSTDGPMHYTANTLYHALEHGATHAWVYFTGEVDPLKIGGNKERLLGYENAPVAREAEGMPGYRVQWDEKTVKVANFDHARSSAIWPEATIAQLRDKAQLDARLPALLAEFKAAMMGAGFAWPKVRS